MKKYKTKLSLSKTTGYDFFDEPELFISARVKLKKRLIIIVGPNYSTYLIKKDFAISIKDYEKV